MGIRRGEIYLANLGDVRHTDIGKVRPVLILQNDLVNRMVDEGLYDEVIIIPLSSRIRENDFTCIIEPRDDLKKRSVLLCNAVKMISSRRLLLKKGTISKLNKKEMAEAEEKVKLIMGIS